MCVGYIGGRGGRVCSGVSYRVGICSGVGVGVEFTLAADIGWEWHLAELVEEIFGGQWGLFFDGP